ncbi:MAG TPA: hypothetical protein VF556_15810 [Pyrinomonadaceae bacterium]|jgi:hypothetical protein
MAKEYESETDITSDKKTNFVKLFLSFGAVTIWALVTGYYLVFSVFAPYDDEGYLMMTVKQFTGGHILYDEVYTQYGPAYYIYKWIPHFLLNIPVTHDVTRINTLLIWVLTALIAGFFAYRLTHSTISGAAAYALTFLALFRTVYEPGHPQEFCGLLVVSGLFFLSRNTSKQNFNIRIALLGAASAFLCLTKVNIGVYLILALGIIFLTFTAKGKWQRIALIGLVFSAAALPFVMFRKHLFIGWLDLGVTYASGLIGALITSLIRTEKVVFVFRHYLIVVLAFTLTAFFIVLFVLLNGSSVEALTNGVILQHFKFGDNFFMAAPIQKFSIFWSLFALLIALSVNFLAGKRLFPGEIAILILKIGFGVAVITTSLLGFYKFLNSYLLLSFATPFLWLLLLKPFKKENKSEDSANFSIDDLPRTALVLIALLQTLQIYPMAGTQMAYATFLMPVIGVLCLKDALGELKIAFPQHFGYAVFTRILAFAALLILIFVGVYRTHNSREIYHSQIPLNFPGATRLRLPEKDADVYNFLVENLNSDCDNFISMPGLYSLHFWTQKEPVNTYNATAWMTLLDNRQQQSIVERLKNYRCVCAVYHPQLTQNGLREQNLQSFPLADYILDNFTTVAEFNEYRFMRQSSPDCLKSATISSK